jgi:hypothetical protein
LIWTAILDTQGIRTIANPKHQNEPDGYELGLVAHFAAKLVGMFMLMASK